jgi:glutaredoxin-like YruB-family protein
MRTLCTTVLLSLFMLLGLGTASAPAATTPPHQTMLNPAMAKKSAYPKIVIYTVAWCPHCRELKEYLTSRAIPFINKDVEIDATAMEELTQKYKSQGVPVIVLGADREILKGFTPESFEKAASRVLAVEKR